MSELLARIPAAAWLIPVAAVLAFVFWRRERRSIKAQQMDGIVPVGGGVTPAAGAGGVAALKRPEDGALPRSRADLVLRLHQLAITRAEDALRWYDAGRAWKKRLGVGLRLMAIAFTAAAGLHPLADQVFGFGQPFDNAVMPSILVALAALLVLFDKFGGHTSGWMRFMKAQTSIDQALAAYKAGWLADRGVEAEPDEERADRLLHRSLKLIRQVDRTVRDETDEWVAEFRKALADSERALEDARRRLESGSVEIVATNYAAIPDGRWTLQVGERSERAVAGARAAETDVPAGIQLVRGSFTANGRLCRDERAADVRPGTVTVVELSFPIPPKVLAGAPVSVGEAGNGQPPQRGAAASDGAEVEPAEALIPPVDGSEQPPALAGLGDGGSADPPDRGGVLPDDVDAEAPIESSAEALEKAGANDG